MVRFNVEFLYAYSFYFVKKEIIFSYLAPNIIAPYIDQSFAVLLRKRVFKHFMLYCITIWHVSGLCYRADYQNIWRTPKPKLVTGRKYTLTLCKEKDVESQSVHTRQWPVFSHFQPIYLLCKHPQSISICAFSKSCPCMIQALHSQFSFCSL